MADDNSNDDGVGLTHFLVKWGEWKEIRFITTKELQVTLMKVLKKTEILDFGHRLGFGSIQFFKWFIWSLQVYICKY